MNSPIKKGVEAESLTAITGVVRPKAFEQLRELSELLGCEVVGVERYEGERGRQWLMTVMEECDGRRQPREVRPLRTFDFKAADRLNALAWSLGRRDPDRPWEVRSPRLTDRDGNRALRLMHEIAEATGRITGLDLRSPSDRLAERVYVADLLTLNINRYEAYREDSTE